MKKILITGGAGYIGSHVIAALGEQGYPVLTYDNLSKGHRDAVLQGELVVGDLADTALLDKTLRDFRPDAVMHFAAFIEVGESVQEPLKYYLNNAANTVNLLNSMSKFGGSKFIFSSTAAVYGDPETSLITEESPIKPVNPYGRAKAFVEKVLQDASTAKGLRYVSLRYFNASGADPLGRIGERHDPESHLIPLILKTAAGRRKSIDQRHGLSDFRRHLRPGLRPCYGPCGCPPPGAALSLRWRRQRCLQLRLRSWLFRSRRDRDRKDRHENRYSRGACRTTARRSGDPCRRQHETEKEA